MFAQFLLCYLISIFVGVPFLYWHMEIKYTWLEMLIAKILVIVFVFDIVYIGYEQYHTVN